MQVSQKSVKELETVLARYEAMSGHVSKEKEYNMGCQRMCSGGCSGNCGKGCSGGCEGGCSGSCYTTAK